VGQPSGVPTGKSGDAGGWEKSAAAVGVSEMGLEAVGPEACLTFAMNVKLASI